MTLLVLLCLWLWPVLTRADDPSFTSREYFGTGLDKTWSVALGDLDGDGDLDIITGNGGDEGEQNRVYLNDGQGNFDKLGNAQSFGTGADNTQSVAVGDVDGDGDLDIAVGNDNYQQSAVYLNNGFGSFNWTGSARPFGGGDLTYSVGLGDVDGDGHLDVVTGNAGQNVVYLNDGSGSFFSDTVDCDIPTVNVRCFGTGEDSTRSVALADVDGDAYLDIVTGNGGDEGEQNRVYLNDGQGNFDLSRNSRFGTGVDSTRAVAVGDMDGDGDLDIVTGNYNQQNVVYLNDGTGSFPSDGGHPFGPVGDSTWSIGVGDLDSDGDLDVVTGNQGEQNVVYINDGQGNFPSGSARRFGTGQDITRSAVSGDVDGDGDLDIVTGNSGQQNVVYLNDGAGDYPSAGVPTFGTGQDSTRSVAVGDMDGDGYLDIVVGNYNQQNVVYVNDASGHYYTGAVECNEASEAIRCFGSGADSTRSVAVGDLNGDG
ncbi:MAG: FG-GAP repeat domain-containing protein, partial [Candidatus Thorarchaeota archaeon]